MTQVQTFEALLTIPGVVLASALPNLDHVDDIERGMEIDEADDAASKPDDVATQARWQGHLIGG